MVLLSLAANKKDYHAIYTKEVLKEVWVAVCLTSIYHLQCKQWLDEITRKPKLRTYITFKTSYELEPYALSFMNRRIENTDLILHSIVMELYH